MFIFKFKMADLSLKFVCSEKATKFCEISSLLLTLSTVVKSKVEISQNFVAFSEYMNFTPVCQIATVTEISNFCNYFNQSQNSLPGHVKFQICLVEISIAQAFWQTAVCNYAHSQVRSSELS